MPGIQTVSLPMLRVTLCEYVHQPYIAKN